VTDPYLRPGAIVSKGKTLQSPNQAQHASILGALAAWRVTQSINEEGK
jgi:hypothetical protein